MAQFEIESGIAVPAVTRNAVGQEKYPFASMEIGQSFFVADEDCKSGDAKKTMNSAVSAAHERFAVKDPDGAMREVKRGANAGTDVPVMIKTRSFTVRSETKDGGPGARVFRIA